MPQERPSAADGGSSSDAADPSAPDATPPSDAVPLAEGVAALAGAAESGMVDGKRNVARFNNPVNVAVDAEGNIYVADFDNHRVRLVTPDGQVTTLVEQPLFRRPFGLAISKTGVVYVQTDDNDSGDHSIETGTIWRIDRITGTASPIARNLGRPRGIAVLDDGHLVLADMMHHTLSILDPATGVLTALAGTRDEPGLADGIGLEARFNQPYDVVVHNDKFFVSDRENNCIRRVTLDGEVSTYAGSCVAGFTDGQRGAARFSNPQGMAVDGDGNLYVTDLANYSIRRIGVDEMVTTIAGNRTAGYRDGEPMQAQFFGLEGHDIGPRGDYLIVADGSRGDSEPYHRVRRISLP